MDIEHELNKKSAHQAALGHVYRTIAKHGFTGPDDTKWMYLEDLIDKTKKKYKAWEKYLKSFSSWIYSSDTRKDGIFVLAESQSSQSMSLHYHSNPGDIQGQEPQSYYNDSDSYNQQQQQHDDNEPDQDITEQITEDIVTNNNLHTPLSHEKVFIKIHHQLKSHLYEDGADFENNVNSNSVNNNNDQKKKTSSKDGANLGLLIKSLKNSNNILTISDNNNLAYPGQLDPVNPVNSEKLNDQSPYYIVNTSLSSVLPRPSHPSDIVSPLEASVGSVLGPSPDNGLANSNLVLQSLNSPSPNSIQNSSPSQKSKSAKGSRSSSRKNKQNAIVEKNEIDNDNKKKITDLDNPNKNSSSSSNINNISNSNSNNNKNDNDNSDSEENLSSSIMLKGYLEVRDLFNLNSRTAELTIQTTVRSLERDIIYCIDNEILSESLRPIPDSDFERLEYLGDAVLYLEISKKQLASTSFSGPGVLTNLRQNMIRRETLAFVFDELNFKAKLKNEILSLNADKWKPKCDVIEAVIGELHTSVCSFDKLPSVANTEQIILLRSRVRRTLDKLVDFIMITGPKLKSQEQLKKMYNQCKKKNIKLV